MGEKQNQPFQLSFNASLKVDFERFPSLIKMTSFWVLFPIVTS